ncbi:MAG: C-GCAxxG-C-C family protein [Lachnospiraceae bacterium]
MLSVGYQGNDRFTDSDKEILTNAASGFAVGMGGMEATCGALIGHGRY